MSWCKSVECYLSRTFNAKDYYWQGILFIKIANELFSWFKHEYTCPDVRPLNATIFFIQRQNLLLVRNIVYEDHKWAYLADWNTRSYILMLKRWILPFPYIQRQTVLLIRNIVSEDHKWVFLSYLITSSYVLMLERWMLPFWYIQLPTVLLIRDNVMKITNESF